MSCSASSPPIQFKEYNLEFIAISLAATVQDVSQLALRSSSSALLSRTGGASAHRKSEQTIPGKFI